MDGSIERVIGLLTLGAIVCIVLALGTIVWKLLAWMRERHKERQVQDEIVRARVTRAVVSPAIRLDQTTGQLEVLSGEGAARPHSNARA